MTDSFSVPPADLLEVVTGMRDQHVKLLKHAAGLTETAGSCFYACIMLQQAIAKFTRCHAFIRGGGGGEGGYLHAGRLRGHYWVQVLTPDGGSWVADVTADQFEGKEVVLESLALASARYVPGSQAEVDAAVQDFLDSLPAA